MHKCVAPGRGQKTEGGIESESVVPTCVLTAGKGSSAAAIKRPSTNNYVAQVRGDCVLSACNYLSFMLQLSRTPPPPFPHIPLPLHTHITDFSSDDIGRFVDLLLLGYIHHITLAIAARLLHYFNGLRNA